jgi:hypothetical protein
MDMSTPNIQEQMGKMVHTKGSQQSVIKLQSETSVQMAQLHT